MNAAKRWWSRFWGLRWRWKIPIIAVTTIIILALAIPSEDKKSDSSDEVAGVASSATGTPTVSATPVETVVTATITAETATPTPTAAAVVTTTPEPTVEDQIAKSYRDNKSFMSRASSDDLTVEWSPSDGFVVVSVAPEALSEGDILTVASHSAIVASKAIWTTYPEVQTIRLDVLADFTDATGATSKNQAVVVTVDRASGERYQYDGLRSRTLSDNKLFICGADAYRIHPAVYRALKDPGCLAQWGTIKVP